MRRLTALFGIATLALAGIYAPVFHVHAGNDHDGAASLFHLHLSGLGESSHHDTEVESAHSHTASRSIDILLTTAPENSRLIAIIDTTPLNLKASDISQGFASIDVPQAHGPPPLISLIPRSPPA